MNTLLLTLMLLSPNEAQLNEQVNLQTTQVLNALQKQTTIELKNQIKETLENMELTLPLAVNKLTVAKLHTEKKQLSED
ncbi:hypothetical protein AMS58_05715 [Pseudoalteromonas porphyrae]|uniref:Uncharacterized protein n=2 Tax=Pseudoalteromonas TaxID=53246 RepID=A0A0N1F0K3_9GAMM|nr:MULTISPECIES: hypothetical protein [Pseudoalteromonas]KPH65480.1 hypothetical protein ADS77_00670 [Pseudoalteromonas porphyrae]KPH95686.1 hypothetical protein AMS58_05715 [Pseudoalteromonas porphyrae]NMR26083.1 hypothetical protein [Pseudoalteromonas sp. NEC-BIFX-2020_015]NNG41758.1 hypothetical protein [Pseudoalteromonas sp. NEC-BIFX-2020_002]